MTKFDRPTLKALRSDLEELLATFNTDKHDIKIELGNCTYSDGEATFKLKVTKNGAKTRTPVKRANPHYHCDTEGY